MQLWPKILSPELLGSVFRYIINSEKSKLKLGDTVSFNKTFGGGYTKGTIIHIDKHTKYSYNPTILSNPLENDTYYIYTVIGTSGYSCTVNESDSSLKSCRILLIEKYSK